MQEVVYVDVLLFVNLFVNYFLLRAAALLSREKSRRWRVLLGAALGSTYSLIIFLPPLHPAFLLALKAVMALSIVFAAFGWGSLRRFNRLFWCFLGGTFLFGGVNYAVYAFLRPGGLLYGNAVIYYDISVPVLVAVTAVCYALAVLIARCIRRSSPDNLEGEAVIELNGKRICVPMMIDSGNGLTDPFSDEPVSLLYAGSAAELLPPQSIAFLLGESELPGTADGQGVRLIPYSAVGGGGVLRAFRCDRLTLTISGRRYSSRGALLAVVREPFDGGRYQLLVHPHMAEQERTKHTTSFRSRGVKREYASKNTVETAPFSGREKENTHTGDLLYQRLTDASAPAGERGGGAHDPAAGTGGFHGAQRADYAQSASGGLHRPQV